MNRIDKIVEVVGMVRWLEGPPQDVFVHYATHGGDETETFFLWALNRARHDERMRDERVRLYWIWKRRGRSIMSGCRKYIRFNFADWPPSCQAWMVFYMARDIAAKNGVKL